MGLCERCERLGVHRRAVHWHHWLAQEHIRVYVRGLRLPGQEASALTGRLLHDQRNLSRVCYDCHGTGSLHMHNFVLADVPLSAFSFAHQLGQEWVARLHHAYPAEAA